MILDLGRGVKFFGTEGSGQQQKCWLENRGRKYLIKIDSKFRETTKEVSVSRILKAAGIEHVEYKKISVNVEGRKRTACICKSYLMGGEQSIPVGNMIRYIQVSKQDSSRDVFNKVVARIAIKTKLSIEIIEDYLLRMMTIDFIVMNPDRHYNNIEFIFDKDKKYRPAPLYDFGQSFLKRDSPITVKDFEGLSLKFKSLPFSRNQRKNLIYTERCKKIAYIVKDRLGDMKNLDIPKFHKDVVRRRIELLLSY